MVFFCVPACNLSSLLLVVVWCMPSSKISIVKWSEVQSPPLNKNVAWLDSIFLSTQQGLNRSFGLIAWIFFQVKKRPKKFRATRRKNGALESEYSFLQAKNWWKDADSTLLYRERQMGRPILAISNVAVAPSGSKQAASKGCIYQLRQNLHRPQSMALTQSPRLWPMGWL